MTIKQLAEAKRIQGETTRLKKALDLMKEYGSEMTIHMSSDYGASVELSDDDVLLGSIQNAILDRYLTLQQQFEKL